MSARLFNLLLCALLLGLSSPAAKAITRPENRVGGSAVFSSDFAAQESANPIGTRAQNPGCGCDFASGVHKYLYAEDDPVDNVDPSGNDDFSIGDSFGINSASIYGLLATTIGTPVTSEPGFENLAFSPSIIVYISVDPSGAPSRFSPSAVQSTLQTELSANVFDHPPAGHSVTIKVHDESSGPGTLEWIGSPKHTYVDRVTWGLKFGIASSARGETSVNPTAINSETSSSPTAQTFANIFAHEVIWLNAGGHWDHNWNPNGEITSGTASAFAPYTVLPSSRSTIRSDFGF